MYRIAVLSDRAELAACFTEQINRFCMERGGIPGDCMLSGTREILLPDS